MDALQQLSNNEKNLLLVSVPMINKNMEFFTIRFYYHFLQTKAKFLFKNTIIEQQHKMFGSSLYIILTYIADPEYLENYVGKLAMNHGEYGIIGKYIDDFVGAFMKALQETLPEDTNSHLFDIWHRVISVIMIFFKSNL